MVPCTHTVIVCDMNGWRGKPLITMGLLKLFSCTNLVSRGELTQTVVPYTHTVVVGDMKGWRGKYLITIELLKLFSSTHEVVTGDLTHTVVPYATVVGCVVKRGGWGGGTPDKHGALKVVFQ